MHNGGNLAICDNVNGPGKHCTKSIISKRHNEKSYMISFIYGICNSQTHIESESRMVTASGLAEVIVKEYKFSVTQVVFKISIVLIANDTA
jgi:hypothetical protein